MRSAAVLASTLAAVVVTGCALGPDYERPKVTAPGAYRGSDASKGPGSLADLPWWRVFGDEPLQALVREALQNNYDIVAAVARVDAARAQAHAASAQLLPAIGGSAGANYGNSFSGAGAVPQPFWVASGAGTATWEIDVFGAHPSHRGDRARRSMQPPKRRAAASG